MIARILNGFTEFINDQFRCPVHGIAHAEVDNIDILTTFFLFQCIQPTKQVRR